jgi:hypothetical protein
MSDSLLFGEALPNTVQYIIGQAYKAKTIEAYKNAVQQLHGIRRLLVFATPEGKVVILRLLNEISKLERVVASGKPL